jgi:hypothetical protein
MRKMGCISIFLVVILLNGCLSTASTSKRDEPPRREFQTVETVGLSKNDIFIANEYISDSKIFRQSSVYFSTALFLADIGILENTTKEQFEKFVGLLFTEFPAEGQAKEIIIPDLSLSEELEHEKDAYLFITKNKNNDGKDYYLVESNVPIASIYAKTYDGYIISLDAGFYKEKIPARWTSIMNVMVNNDILLYRGIAYPSKSAPLIFTGTGIGSDVRMNSIISGQSTLTEIKNQLKKTVEQALETTKPENQRQIDSMKFLEKSTDISLSAYSYIESNIEDAKQYYLLSQGIDVDIPDDTMGSRYKELEKIMNYLLNIIGE